MRQFSQAPSLPLAIHTMCVRRFVHRTVVGFGQAAVALLLCSGLAFAEGVSMGDASSDRQRARVHAQHGYELSQAGSFEEAARHFEAAQALEPSAAVLYNLGQAHAASGRPVEALSAFRKSLHLPGSGLTDSLRERIVEATRIVEARIGQITLRISPPSATVLLDGQSLSPEALGQPLDVKAGVHTVVSQLQGFNPRVVVVDVPPKGNTITQITLTRTPAPAYVAVACKVPDMNVSVDGAPPQQLARLTAVDAGRHVVRLSRLGYVDETFHVQVSQGAVAELACRGDVDPTASEAVMGSVSLERLPAVAAYVDGELVDLGLRSSDATQLTIRVPIGRHSVELRRNHYQSWQQDIEIESRASLMLRREWVPTAEYRRELNEVARARTDWATVAWGAGATLAVSSIVLGFTATYRHDDWLRERRTLNQSPIEDSSTQQRLRDSQSRALGIQRLNDSAIGFGVLAAGVLGAAAMLQWWGAPEIETPLKDRQSPLPLVVTAGPEGAHVHFSGTL